jgi:hypothetical protein
MINAYCGIRCPAEAAEVFSEVRLVVTMVEKVNGEENEESLSSAQHQ